MEFLMYTHIIAMSQINASINKSYFNKPTTAKCPTKPHFGRRATQKKNTKRIQLHQINQIFLFLSPNIAFVSIRSMRTMFAENMLFSFADRIKVNIYSKNSFLEDKAKAIDIESHFNVELNV